MGLFDFLSRPIAERKESRAASVVNVNPNQPIWTPRDYASFAREGYQLNVIAYQAINRVAEAVADVRWTVWRDDKEIDKHPIADLLKRPNRMQSGYEFMTAVVGYLMISGNTYIERVQVQNQTKELYALRPDRMKILPSKRGIPAGYIYSIGGREVHTFEVDEKTLQSDVNHMKLFNPLNDWYGMGPIEAGAYAIDQHTESMKWMQSLLQNSARPSGALQASGDNALTDEQFARLKTQIEDQYSGAKNAGRPMVLEGGLTWQAMGLSPSDLALLETKYSAARDVSLAFGVPPQLLNIPGDNTYSNYEQARLAFYEDTVIPLINRVSTSLSNWLGVEQDQVELRPDLDQIPAIAEKRKALWTMADLSTDLTLNERRGLKGYEPVAGGDVVLVGSGMISLADAAAPLDVPPSVKTLAKIAGYE